MKIFITGVSGFVGSGLVEYFQQSKDVSLFGHSRNSQAVREQFKDLNIEIVADYSAAAFDSLGVDHVIHLAGIAHDLSNRFTTEDYYRVNLEGTKNAFDQFLKSKASKFIFVSSIKACIDSSLSPVNEDAVPTPTSHYGKSKQMAEQFLLSQPLPPGKKLYIFRPCMIHGKGNKGNLNSLYKYVKSGMPYIFGAYNNQRSFLTLENLNFIVHDFLKNDYSSGLYHLADDRPLSTNELIRIISKSLNKEPRIWNVPATVIEPLSRIASFLGLPTEKLKQKLTESLVVSTTKLKKVMGKSLPVDSTSGLLKTLEVFSQRPQRGEAR